MVNSVWVFCALGGLLIVGTLCILLIKLLPPQLKYQRLPSTSDIIDYATLVEENVIALKSGGLISIYTIRLPDLSMKPQAYINHIYEVAQKTLLKLNGNYCLHIDVIRNRSENYLPFLEVTNPVLHDLEQRRKLLFANQGCFYSELFLTITFMGNSAADEVLEDIMISSDPEENSDEATIKALSEFKQACSDVVTGLKQCFDIRPLGSRTIPIKPQVAQNYLDFMAQHPDLLLKENKESQDISTDRVNYQVNMQQCVLTQAIKDAEKTKQQQQKALAEDTQTSSTPQALPASQDQAIKEAHITPHHDQSSNVNSTHMASDVDSTADSATKADSTTTSETSAPSAHPAPESNHEPELNMEDNAEQCTADEAPEPPTCPSLESSQAQPTPEQKEAGETVATGEKTPVSKTLGAKIPVVESIESKSPESQTPQAPDQPQPVDSAAHFDSAEKQENIEAQTTPNLSCLKPCPIAPMPVQTVIDNSDLALNSGHSQVVKIHEGLSFLHQCVTGSSAFLSAPKYPCFIDAIIGNQDFQPGFPPVMGQQYVGVIALDGLPNESTQGMLDQLATLPFVYRFSTRFVYFDNMHSNILLNKYRRLWDQKLYGFFAQLFKSTKAKRNQNAEQKVAEVDDAIRALDNNEIIFGSYTACIVIMDTSLNLLQSKLRDTAKVVESLGFTARIETINATEAFLGSLPGHFFENLRRPIVSQDVLMDFIPLSVPALGEMTSPNSLYGNDKSPLMQVRTSGMSTYLLNLHDQDLGNTLVIGPPGSGKSVLLGSFIINLLRYRHMRVFAFDQGFSFYALTKALQGTHVELSNNKASLCPLLHIEDEKEADYALNFLVSMYEVNGISIDAQDYRDIKEGIRILLTNGGSGRSLSDLHMVLTNNRLKDGLIPFLNGSNSVSIIDGQDNVDLDEILTTFECGDIFKLSNRFAMPVLKQLFHVLEQKFDGNPAAIVLDEAWLLLQHPTFSAEIIKWIKTLRKYNVIVILATQTLSDLEHSNEFSNLLECAKTRVYLANYSAESLPIALQYSKLGLSPQEIYAIAHAQAKRDYFFVKGEQHVMFNLILSEPELRLLSFAGPQAKPLVDHLYQAYGPSFYAKAS